MHITPAAHNHYAHESCLISSSSIPGLCVITGLSFFFLIWRHVSCKKADVTSPHYTRRHYNTTFKYSANSQTTHLAHTECSYS